MNSCLKNFRYSQNSINTYKSCPLKFKYKYIDRINWKYDDIEHREYYESLKTGTDFHLLCERYFSNIPLGINSSTNTDFQRWMDKVKKLVPIKEGYLYLPEYEVMFNLDRNIIQAKYDLIIIKDNKIEIWDWKTENKKFNYKNVESRIQTIVYMLLAKEVIPNLLDKDIDTQNISMKYYQPEFDDNCVSISYNNEKHKQNKNKVLSYIDYIKNTNYNKEDKEYKYELVKNKKHCKYCEFNKLCNNEEVDRSVFEEDIYEC
ncbi:MULTISPECIES: PD-(D/E)XK nuclease family protein [unclassified Romboutsia]|uniref:PD-(D/E)XK nuclease family protein n=1 Tax=unclassified Romboutsia TaxID=2626894 RepID=UPI00189A520E|nr:MULTISPECIES: PD-(D/E)XK nuclease family protein [unclassified Romboutsia]MDB8804166.1 PD-(D/E)XK nuclease family protein [Romboutsia sp. 1001216sp1]MDB8808867.1 PD-(D/E)XK nuclease family protein [Romboutsia sp. 1001216sp1]MDB8809812.1 PD-(D/E)XK nuclease family protein [Romboutsia sp. 1001216sp1]MDB8815562.1 PD-(D/E)XK nuclease family protein [Romboutsia sp. 1001216sp1]MDB8820338.1 PD-(D/E)XK nuclease family protein [Romboutsia sp. 1001216sp1]